MKTLILGSFTVKNFIENNRTEKNIEIFKKSLELYKTNKEFINELTIEKLEYLINLDKNCLIKHSSPKYKLEQVEQWILNGNAKIMFSEIYDNVIDEFEWYKSMDVKINYSNEAIDYLENCKKYFKDLCTKEYDKNFLQEKTIEHSYSNEDIIITDSCYLFGNNNAISRDLTPPYDLYANTIYGDWSCSCFNKDTKEKIGNFCSDAGNVCVATLKNVLEFNPNFKNWMADHNHCVTLIKNFTGKAYIKYAIEEYQYKNKKEKELFCYVEGEGNINFISRQTGF